MNFKIVKVIPVKIAEKGTVNIHDKTIFFMTPRFKLEIPLAIPTPITAPTIVCVVEIGNPSFENIKTVVAQPNSAENPLVGVISVTSSPTVFITLYPKSAVPSASEKLPKNKIHIGIKNSFVLPDFIIEYIAQEGPIAFAISFAP